MNDTIGFIIGLVIGWPIGLWLGQVLFDWLDRRESRNMPPFKRLMPKIHVWPPEQKKP